MNISDSASFDEAELRSNAEKSGVTWVSLPGVVLPVSVALAPSIRKPLITMLSSDYNFMSLHYRDICNCS